jgi:hypothetical protein
VSKLDEFMTMFQSLTLDERAEFFRRIEGWEDDDWDRQMAADAAAGKFDKWIAELDADAKAGLLRDLP